MAEAVLSSASSAGSSPASEPPTSAGAAQASDVVASSCRSVGLGALIGGGAVLTAQLTIKSHWVARFVSENSLDMARRTTLLVSATLGALVGAVLVAAALALGRRRGVGARDVERFVWFLSPLALLPTLPLLFRHEAWDGRYEPLLLTLALVGFLVERTLFRAHVCAPPTALAWLGRVRDRVPAFVRSHGPLVLVVVGAVLYAAFMSTYTVQWHYKLKTNNFDLSINNNLMYGGLEGELMKSPVVFGHNPERYLAAHAKYGGYVFLPLYALYPKPQFLLVLQSTLLGASVIPLFCFARKRISDWAAAIVCVCFLCYYPMHGANFYEVKWVPIATFFVIATIWAVDAKRWVLFVLSFLVAAWMREDVPIGLAVAGAFLLMSGHRPKAGLFMLVTSVAIFVYVRGFLMPSAGKWWFPTMYKGLWAPGEKGFSSVIKTLLSNQPYVLTTLLEKHKLFYVMHLLTPLAFLPLRRPYLWAAFIPGAVLTLLTTGYLPTITFSFQYVMHWMPYIFLATPVALASIGRMPDLGRPRMRAAIGAMLFASVVLTYNWGAFPKRSTFQGGYNRVSFTYSDKERERYEELLELVAMIPPQASVAATEHLGPHVSSRKTMYSMRRGPQRAEYILAWRKDLRLERTRPSLQVAVGKKRYGVVARRWRGEFALLKKGHDPSGNEQLMKDWRL